jgi:hypothetical protein
LLIFGCRQAKDGEGRVLIRRKTCLCAKLSGPFAVVFVVFNSSFPLVAIISDLLVCEADQSRKMAELKEPIEIGGIPVVDAASTDQEEAVVEVLQTSHGHVVDHGLHRGLKQRHLQMIALGGVVGYMLFSLPSSM